MEEPPSVNNAEITRDIDNILKYNQDAFSKRYFRMISKCSFACQRQYLWILGIITSWIWINLMQK